MSSAQDEVRRYWRALRICQGTIPATHHDVVQAYRDKLCLALYSRGKAGALARKALLKYHGLTVVPYGVATAGLIASQVLICIMRCVEGCC